MWSLYVVLSYYMIIRLTKQFPVDEQNLENEILQKTVTNDFTVFKFWSPNNPCVLHVKKSNNHDNNFPLSSSDLIKTLLLNYNYNNSN